MSIDSTIDVNAHFFLCPFLFLVVFVHLSLLCFFSFFFPRHGWTSGCGINARTQGKEKQINSEHRHVHLPCPPSFFPFLSVFASFSSATSIFMLSHAHQPTHSFSMGLRITTVATAKPTQSRYIVIDTKYTQNKIKVLIELPHCIPDWGTGPAAWPSPRAFFALSAVWLARSLPSAAVGP